MPQPRSNSGSSIRRFVGIEWRLGERLSSGSSSSVRAFRPDRALEQSFLGYQAHDEPFDGVEGAARPSSRRRRERLDGASVDVGAVLSSAPAAPRARASVVGRGQARDLVRVAGSSARAARNTGARRAPSAAAAAISASRRWPTRIRKLNDRIIDAGKEAGETTLSAYEKALKALAASIERGAGPATSSGCPSSRHPGEVHPRRHEHLDDRPRVTR